MRDAVVLGVFVGKAQSGPQRHLGADDAMAAVEALFPAEHVHGTALAARIAAGPPGQFRHDPLGVHAADQHMAVVAIAGDAGIGGAGHRLHADHHRLLSDIKVAKAVDQPHAVQLPRLFLESADQQHLAIVLNQFVGGRFRHAPFLHLGNHGSSRGP